MGWWWNSLFSIDSQLITLTKDSQEEVFISKIIEYGAYEIFVEDANDKTNGCNAIFNVCVNVRGASITRTCTQGQYSESIHVSWPAGSTSPTLKYHNVPVGDAFVPIEQTFKVTFSKTV